MTSWTRFTFVLTLAALLLAAADSRPAADEEPTKFSLDTAVVGLEDAKDAKESPATDKSTTVQANSRIQDGMMEWLDRMMDAIRFGRGRLVNSVAVARNIIAERVEELMSETRNNVAGAIGAANDIIVKGRSTLQSYENTPLAQFLPPRTRETVRLENSTDQAILERKKTGNPISAFLDNILKPKPIVDNIREEEKYGNNGDKFIGVGRALVNGFEGLSNFLNAVVDLPLSAAKKTSRGITEALNQIGSRLVGLQ